jgi:regulator of protease activity HflC (stomatin/prohibitin superfamily)
MLETFLLFVALLVLLFVMMSIKIVHQGHRYTIEHFGRFVRVADPGFNFVPAFFYRVGRKINMMEQVLDIPGAGDHHQGQCHGRGRRRGLLPGARPRQGGL